MSLTQWKIIETHKDDQTCRDTSVRSVPGGVVLRERSFLVIRDSYQNEFRPAISLVFIPGAKIEDFDELS